MGWMAYYSLIQIPYGQPDMPIRACHRPWISKAAIPTNPHRRTLRYPIACLRVQPLVKLDGAAPHIGVRRPRHLQSLAFMQNPLPIERLEN